MGTTQLPIYESKVNAREESDQESDSEKGRVQPKRVQQRVMNAGQIKQGLAAYRGGKEMVRKQRAQLPIKIY